MHSLVATSYLNSIEPGSFARLLSFPLDSTIPFFVGYVHSRARCACVVPHRASLIRYYLVVPYRLQFAMRVARDNDFFIGCARNEHSIQCYYFHRTGRQAKPNGISEDKRNAR